MTHAELIDGRIVCDVPMREQGLIKQLPARWHKDTLRWRMTLSWSSCLALRGVFGSALEIGPALTEWAYEEIHDRIDPALWWREVALDMGYGPTDNEQGLYPHQYTAARFLRAAGSALLADEVGVGKTASVIEAVVAEDAWPLLVVAPKSMGRTWQRELAHWAGVDALVLEGTATQRAKAFDAWYTAFTAAGDGAAGAVIVSYEILRSHSRLAPYGSIALSAKEKTPGLLNQVIWGAVIADEAHRAKDARAKQTRALWAVGDIASHRYALTGTPIANNVGDLWALLRFISPDEWPARTAFLERYAETSLSHWGGLEILGLKESNRAEFDRIFNPRFLRRTKELVLPHLPAKVYETREVEMRPAQAKAYRQLAEGMVADLESGRLMTFNPLQQGMRLVQFASSMCEVEDTGEFNEDGTAVQVVRMVEPSPKLDVLEEILDELEGLPVTVFAQSRQLLDLAAARFEKQGRRYAQLVGGQHTLERQDAIDRFNAGHVDLILISLGAGAEGVSLTRGSHAVFLDRSWNAVQNQQAEGRQHGTGRGDKGAVSMTYIDLCVRGTVEDRKTEALGNKAEALEELVRDRELLLASLRGSK